MKRVGLLKTLVASWALQMFASLGTSEADADDDGTVLLDVRAVGKDNKPLASFSRIVPIGETTTIKSGTSHEDESPPLFVGISGTVAVFGSQELRVDSNLEYLGPRGYKGNRLLQQRLAFSNAQLVTSGDPIRLHGDGVDIIVTLTRK